MAHKKGKKYPVNTTCQNVSCLLLRLKSRLGKDEISADPGKDFLPHLTTPLLDTIKAPLENRYQRNNGFCLPLIDLPYKVHYQQVFHPNCNWTRTAGVGVFNQDVKTLCPHWIWTQISLNENRKLATQRIESGTVLTGNPQS